MLALTPRPPFGYGVAKIDPRWPWSTDRPIMRPATDRLRACHGVSGVLNKHERRFVFASQSVRESHGAVVKTVVKTEA
jgi:hypothetical protein